MAVPRDVCAYIPVREGQVQPLRLAQLHSVQVGLHIVSKLPGLGPWPEFQEVQIGLEHPPPHQVIPGAVVMPSETLAVVPQGGLIFPRVQ